MLQAKDLMIGDWVIYNPNVFIEDEYERPQEPYPIQVKTGEEIDLAFEDCYSPIPLTSEILEKNGFDIVSPSANKNIWWLENFSIYEHHNKKKYPYFWISIGGNTDIKYVHQLQHALQLCGIEKEIKL